MSKINKYINYDFLENIDEQFSKNINSTRQTIIIKKKVKTSKINNEYPETFKYNESSFPKLPIIPSYKCNICFQYTQYKTKCNHIICRGCFNKWKHIKSTCPICRREI